MAATFTPPDKAQIIYEVDGVESTLRFHTVIAEEHEATTQITKFPVQSGFNISNHAIKMNRVVTISGAVTNHQVVGGETFNNFDDSKNVVRLMFAVLKELVRGAVPCKVTTNYGKYDPVIFTKFKTKLVAGKTDMMEFTMRGEEVQLATTINGNKPNLLVFTELSANKREARVAEFANAGIPISTSAKLSEAIVDMNESFQIQSRDDLGNTSITTYERVASDLTSSTTHHLISTSITDYNGIIESNDFINSIADALPSLPDISLSSGASTVSACISENTEEAIVDVVDDEIDTVFGKLESSLYGGKYSITGVNGNQTLGQIILGVGIDCVVAGATGNSSIAGSSEAIQQDIINNLPSIDLILNGASSLGETLADNTFGKPNPVTLTKISCGC